MLRHLFVASFLVLISLYDVSPGKAQEVGAADGGGGGNQDHLRPGRRVAVLEAIRARAVQIGRAHQGCAAFDCATVGCPQKVALLQALTRADSVLDQYLEAYNAQALDGALINVSLLSEGDVDIAQWELARHGLRRIQILRALDANYRDLTALKDFFDGRALDKFLQQPTRARLDVVRERMREAEEVVAGLQVAVERLRRTTDRLPDAKAAADAAPLLADELQRLGYLQATADSSQIKAALRRWHDELAGARTALGDMVAAADKAARAAASPEKAAAAARQLVTELASVGGQARAVVDRVTGAYPVAALAARRQRIIEHEPEIAAGADARSFYRQWRGILVEQAATRAALAAVRAALGSVSSCLRKWCGVYTLKTRPRGIYVNPQDREYSWVVALKALGPEVDALARALPASTPAVAPAACPVLRKASDAGVTDVKLFGVVGEEISAEQRRRARCDRCQHLARAVNLAMARLVQVEGEIVQVWSDGRSVEVLPAEQQKQVAEAEAFRERIDQLTALAGRDPGGEQGAQLAQLKAEAYLRDAQAEYVGNEIARLKASARKLKGLEAEAAHLKALKKRLSRALGDCEQRFCPMAQASASDVAPPEDDEPPLSPVQQALLANGLITREAVTSKTTPARSRQRSAAQAGGKVPRKGRRVARRRPSLQAARRRWLVAMGEEGTAAGGEGKRGPLRAFLSVGLFRLQLNDLEAEFLQAAASGTSLASPRDDAGVSGARLDLRLGLPGRPAGLVWLDLGARFAAGEAASGTIAFSADSGGIAIPFAGGSSPGVVSTDPNASGTLQHRRDITFLDLTASVGRPVLGHDPLRLSWLAGIGYSQTGSDEKADFRITDVSGVLEGSYRHDGVVDCLRGFGGLEGQVLLGDLGGGVMAGLTARAELGLNRCRASIDALTVVLRNGVLEDQGQGRATRSDSFFYTRLEAGVSFDIPTNGWAPMQLSFTAAASKGAMPVPQMVYDYGAADPADVRFNDGWTSEISATLRIPLGPAD